MSPRNRGATPPRAPSKRRRRRRKASAASSAETTSRAPSPGVARVRALAGWVGMAAACLVFGATAWIFVVYPSEMGPGAGRAVELTLPEHPTADALARALAAAGVVAHPRLFALWVRLTGGAGEIVSGDHLLTDDASPRDLVARLERRGTGKTARVTIPEGFNRFDVARRLQDKHVVALRGFLEATTDPALLRELGVEGDSAEGFLFPATYDLPLDADPSDVVRRMKREFDRRWDLLSRAHPSTLADVMSSAHLGVRDIVTLASMVEKEAVVDEERPLVASVFLNRLRDPSFHPHRLECDPTASYGCIVAPDKAASCATFTGKATASIEHDPDNPYSTYTHEGLPPGPIANPGAKSLEGVMSPASSRFFFFVAKGEGRHAFSETYAAHSENVSALRKAP